MQDVNLYESASVIGGCIFALCILAYIACWCGQYIYAWLDDTKVGDKNIILKKVAYLFGLKDRKCNYETMFPYETKKGDISTGGGEFILSVLILSVIPLVIVLALDFVFIAICIISFIGSAHLARFCFRHKKLFDKHLSDKGVHKSS